MTVKNLIPQFASRWTWSAVVVAAFFGLAGDWFLSTIFTFIAIVIATSTETEGS